MNLNRDEFLLLSRTGRGPYSTRAGPGPDERFEAGLTPRRLRRVSRTTVSPGEDSYFEMEFAVGFPVEEETLR